MSKLSNLSVTQYAAIVGLTRQAVLWQIKHKKDMPGVLHVQKVGSTYVLTVFATLAQK